MPSEKVLAKKKELVSEVADKIKDSVAGVLVDYTGISVAEDAELRAQLREAGVDYKVVKNSILSRAFEKVKMPIEKDVLQGNTALAVSAEDHVAASRILSKFAKNKKTFKIKTGYLDGELISLENIAALSKLPDRDVLLATVCNVFNAPIASFARVVQAIVDKGPQEESAEQPAEA